MAMALADPNLPDCPLVYVNQAFTDMTGYSSDAILGRNCRLLQGPETDPAAVERIRDSVAERKPITVEIYNYRQDGSGFWNELYVSPVFDDAGNLDYFFASQIDITIRKEAERRQKQRSESMDALVSGIAHEVNNLMTVVLGNIERVGVHLVDEARGRNLRHAALAARRASEIAGNLLYLAGRKTEHEEIVDVNQVIRDCENTLTSFIPSRVQVQMDLAATPLFARLDRRQLEVALGNLVGNAAESISKAGRITFTSRPLSPSVSALDGSEAVELTVSDTGQGMQPKVLERATEVFFTTKPDANGLGLFLVLDFVERSNGKLQVESNVGSGTTVRMIFPRTGEH
jgi:PAS domain S-box-containing protein